MKEYIDQELLRSHLIAMDVAAFMETVVRLKPVSSKGTYLKGVAITTTMGPGVKVDTACVKDLIK